MARKKKALSLLDMFDVEEERERWVIYTQATSGYPSFETRIGSFVCVVEGTEEDALEAEIQLMKVRDELGIEGMTFGFKTVEGIGLAAGKKWLKSLKEEKCK